MANDVARAIGVQAAAPSAGTVVMVANEVEYPDFHLTFTLTGAALPVTDAAGSGSYGSLNLFTFNNAAVATHGCRQDYTAFSEGALLTGAAGDLVFDIGVGSVAIAAAADGALATTSDDIGTETGAITLSGGTATSTGVNAGICVDGTTTATKIALNISATAATCDASDDLFVTGTITVAGILLNDD